MDRATFAKLEEYLAGLKADDLRVLRDYSEGGRFASVDTKLLADAVNAEFYFRSFRIDCGEGSEAGSEKSE